MHKALFGSSDVVLCQCPVSAATCSDGIQNGNETATDCGGSSCNKCAVDATCVGHGDCLSNNCIATTTSTFNNATNTTTNVTTSTCAAGNEAWCRKAGKQNGAVVLV